MNLTNLNDSSVLNIEIFIISIMSVKNVIDVRKCPYERDCMCLCDNCELMNGAIGVCSDDCEPVCESDENYKKCGFYDIMEGIREDEAEAGMRGGIVVDIEKHRLFEKRMGIVSESI